MWKKYGISEQDVLSKFTVYRCTYGSEFLVKRKHGESQELTNILFCLSNIFRGAPFIILEQSVFVTGRVDSQAFQVSIFHNADVCIFAKLMYYLIIYSYKTNPSFLPCPWNLLIGPTHCDKSKSGKKKSIFNNIWLCVLPHCRTANQSTWLSVVILLFGKRL